MNTSLLHTTGLMPKVDVGKALQLLTLVVFEGCVF